MFCVGPVIDWGPFIDTFRGWSKNEVSKSIQLHYFIFITLHKNSHIFMAMTWVSLKIGYIPNEIAIFHRDNDQQNYWV